jgi:D-alanyl-D-alanine carboxypeptidase
VLTVEAALRVLMVKSANDIAVALAESVAGSEPAFINQMNQAARAIGMERTSSPTRTACLTGAK